LSIRESRSVRLSDLRVPGGLDKESYIRALYRVLLCREPDASGMSRLLARDDAQNFFMEIISSQEFRRLARLPAYGVAGSFSPTRQRRVLLFGAYGNGNLGDAIQALSLARAINRIRPDIEVWAASALPSTYPFDYQRTLGPEAVLRPAVINSFDLLLIGGGGLLSHPHDPLTDLNWQHTLQLPVALFGIGADPATASKSETLIRRSVYVSGRDPQSIHTLSTYAKDVKFVPDPVLCDSFYVRKDNPHHDDMSDRQLWILKFLHTESFKRLCAAIAERGASVCFVEPHLDFRITQYLPNAVPIYDTHTLLSMMDNADTVFSMRYHGCIFAMLRRKTVFGLYEPKCLSLLRRYGAEKNFSAELAYVTSVQGQPRWDDEQLVRDRLAFRSALEDVLRLVTLDSVPADIVGESDGGSLDIEQNMATNDV
jgi:polysaccharide pyruvyl transferase WcaK-like protein